MRTILHKTMLILAGGFLVSSVAYGQEVSSPQSNSFSSFRVGPESIVGQTIGKLEPSISVERARESKDFQGTLLQDALNFNLGLQLAPFEGLSLRADAWSQQIDDAPANSLNENSWTALPQLFIQDSAINEFNLENPLIGSNVETKGFDLGAAYVWETDRFGQFTLSSTTTYVNEFENNGSLLELLETDNSGSAERVISPELQSNLMLTWEFGNHKASAITNYFDSFKDISELDLNEINELVDNMTTIDLQYGYSVDTGDNDRAIISFGIRNIFNEESAQILNATTRLLDQNGRVAYGSIKYQF